MANTKPYKGKTITIDPTDCDAMDELFVELFETKDPLKLEDLKQCLIHRDCAERYLIVFCRHLVSHRVTKLEKKLKRSVLAWVEYCMNFPEINTINIPNLIMKSKDRHDDRQIASLKYIRHIAKCRVKELEDIIIRRPFVAEVYAHQVIKDYWEEAETFMTEDMKEQYRSTWTTIEDTDDAHNESFSKREELEEGMEQCDDEDQGEQYTDSELSKTLLP